MNRHSKLSRLLHPSFSFLFDDDDNVIEYWFSWISGLEKIYANGQLVSSKRIFRKNSKHDFTIGDVGYSVYLDGNSIFTMSRNCSLEKAGKLIGKKELCFLKKGQPTLMAIDTTIGFIVALLVFIVCKVNYDWPQWSYQLFAGFLIVTHPIIFFMRIKPEARDIDLA